MLLVRKNRCKRPLHMPALIISSTDKKTLPILIAQLRSADYLKFDMGQVYVLISSSDSLSSINSDDVDASYINP